MERKTQALTSDSETAVLMEIQKSVPTPAAPQLREFHLLRGKSDVCRLCLHCISVCVCRSRWLAGSAGGVRSRLYVYCSNTANTEQGKH